MKKIISPVIYLFLLPLLFGCAMNPSETNHNAEGNEIKNKLVIGGKDFTEQDILLKITAIYLKANGYEIEEVRDMKSHDLRTAIVEGNIDLYWEYTGTALMLYLNKEGVSDPDEAYQIVKELDEANGIHWLKKSGINNTYTILVRDEFSKEFGIKTISDLARYINKSGQLKFASETEFYKRNDGLKGLEETYQFSIPDEFIIRLNSLLTYHALNEKKVDAIVGFVTDGSIQAYNLVALEDDLSFFPAYNATPVLNTSSKNENKDIEKLLSAITDRLDNETMMRLNYDVDIKRKDVIEVSVNWLKDEGLVE